LPSTLEPLLLAWCAALYGGASLVCFIAYALDKSAAIHGRRRTPERSLLLLGLACGWPGALLAQRWLRHKTVKTSFRIAFWCTVALNIAIALGLALWLLPWLLPQRLTQAINF
jgi:uncharacterized membrane protein YsdA (DUF1294 family)